MAAKADIISFIKAYADTLSLRIRKALGTTGQQILVDGDVVATGQAWTATDGSLDPIIHGIGQKIDTIEAAATAWAEIATNATGVPPTVVNHRRIGTVTKDEITGQLTISFSPAFAVKPAVVAAIEAGVNRSLLDVVSVSASQAVIRFFEATAFPLPGANINSKIVLFQAIGNN